MNINTLHDAIWEAQQFLKKAEPLAADMREKAKTFPYHDGVASASVKRASMDLTRALAKMRRPG